MVQRGAHVKANAKGTDRRRAGGPKRRERPSLDHVCPEGVLHEEEEQMRGGGLEPEAPVEIVEEFGGECCAVLRVVAQIGPLGANFKEIVSREGNLGSADGIPGCKSWAIPKPWLGYVPACETGCNHHFRSREMVSRATARTRICAWTAQPW
jgi:hypothetical protein